MRKLCLNDELLVLLGPIISRFFACSYEEKNKPKQQKVHALVLSLWVKCMGQHTLLNSNINPQRHLWKGKQNRISDLKKMKDKSNSGKLFYILKIAKSFIDCKKWQVLWYWVTLCYKYSVLNLYTFSAVPSMMNDASKNVHYKKEHDI